MRSKKRAIFLDRDGIINVDHGYVYKIEEFEFTTGIFETLHALQSQGFLLIIVTNQSGIGRGYYSEEAYQNLTQYIVESFSKKDIKVDAVYHCPHHPEANCQCRKPRIGMLKAAQKEFKLDMKNSWMIGDKNSDMLVGKNAGVENRIFVSIDEISHEATYCVKCVEDIVEVMK